MRPIDEATAGTFGLLVQHFLRQFQPFATLLALKFYVHVLTQKSGYQYIHQIPGEGE